MAALVVFFAGTAVFAGVLECVATRAWGEAVGFLLGVVVLLVLVQVLV